MGATVQLVDASAGVANKWRVMRLVRSAALVFVQRRFLPNWVLSGKAPMVFDIDDAIWSSSSGQSAPGRERRFQRMVKRSSLVITGNAFLAEHCAGTPTLVAPTAVAPMRCKVHEGPATHLVWIGSKSTARYLEYHAAALDTIGARFPDLQLTVVADFDFRLEKLTVNNVRWSPDAEQQALLQADIGIAPMIDNTWTRGKCALKVLQYMSAGLPVISSDVGANREVVVSGQTGLLAADVPSWLTAVQQLMDATKRQQMGEAGYQRLVDHYSPEPVFSSVIQAFREHGWLNGLSL